MKNELIVIFQKWGNMKFAYRNREFWCKGYYVDTVEEHKGDKNIYFGTTEKGPRKRSIKYVRPTGPIYG